VRKNKIVVIYFILLLSFKGNSAFEYIDRSLIIFGRIFDIYNKRVRWKFFFFLKISFNRLKRLIIP